MRNLNYFDVLIREPLLAYIVKKVMADNPRTVSEIISGDTPFGIPTNPKGSKKNPIDLYDTENNENNTRLFYIESSEKKKGCTINIADFSFGTFNLSKSLIMFLVFSIIHVV